MAEHKKKGEDEASSKHRFTSICVLGEANLGKDEEFMSAAHDLGKVLAARGINIVYGGGVRGLRGCVATCASLGGSKVLSLLIKNFPDNHLTYPTIGNEFRVSNMPERMGYMLYSSEAFIALPGGLETLDGISSIAFWSGINFHNKPLGLLNVNGFYDGFLSFLDHAVEQGFISQATRHTIVSASTADQLIDKLQVYEPAPGPSKKRVDSKASSSSKKRKRGADLHL